MKAKWLYWLDVFLFVDFLILGVSSFLLWLIFPQGYFPSRLFWVEVHKWSGLALYVGVLLHLGLHWRWIVRMTSRQFGAIIRRSQTENWEE